MEKDNDKEEELAGLSEGPNRSNKKVQSYSQQLSPGPKKPHHQVRKHSLDDLPKTNVLNNDDLSSPVDTQQSSEELASFEALPEFIGSGGGAGIFKVPARATVHPGRPPCLELRPHPLRETQVGKFLRNLACSDKELWAGQENGVRVWSMDKVYDKGWGLGGRVRRGDEDAAPFYESITTPPTLCLCMDKASKLVWSGHKDGKIRSWKMDQDFRDDSPFKEGLSWQAHKGPVLSIAISSYGDIWSGGEGGVIKIWPWESVEKSLSLSSQEKRMAALLVERSLIDLRSQVTVNGACNISSSDVKCLLTDNVRARVWDARTKELVKVFNIDGQVENRAELPSGPQEQQVEDEMKVKLNASGKKDKPQGFLQRSRNAIMGAADAVRRVATRGAGAFQEDSKRTEALVLTADGMIWSGCTNGLLVQWDGNGTRLQDLTHHSCAIQCFCTVGARIYVGYVSGVIQVLDLEGNLIAVWVAHSNPVLRLAVGNGYIFSLATHGGIRGWNIASPGPGDGIIRSELAGTESLYTRQNNFRVLVGTWNVGQGRASNESLMAWLGSVASDVGIVVVGLQEVEMGAGFLAMSAAKETVGLEGSALGQWWLDAIGKALDEGTRFERMGSRQLAALLISLWVRKDLRTHVGDVDAAAVPCGFGRAIGNKGGVGLRIRVHDRTICFVNCHLAAHLEAVNRRNADFDHIFRTMVFSKQANFTEAAGVATASQMLKGANAVNVNSEETRTDLSEADMVVFFGDFNYRLFGISYDEARDFVSQRCFDWLRERDQLRAEMKAGKVFQGMREALIRFPPTYKFEKGQPGLAGYDSGEKKRIPAWCDRIIYRDNRSTQVSECSLECPVITSIILYEACMEVLESDHKPVRCKFHVQVAHVDRSVRREEFGQIVKSNEKIKAMLEDLRYVPETTISTNNIVLQNQDTHMLRINNKCSTEKAVFRITCEGQSTIKEDDGELEFHSRGSHGFPRWLEVTPAGGVIKPDQSAEISVHHEEFHTLEEFVDGIPQNWWCEDTRDKEVILIVNVQGSGSQETITHRVNVRHCFSAKQVRLDSGSGSSGPRGNQGGSSHRKQQISSAGADDVQNSFKT